MTATRVGQRWIYEVAACDDGSFALFRSGDGGESWSRADLPAGLHDSAGATVAFVSRRTGFLLYALDGERGRLYRTVDGGRSWRRASVPSVSGLLAADGRVFAYDRREIYTAPGDGRLHRLGTGIGPSLFAFDGALYDEAATKGTPGKSVVVVRRTVESRERLPCHRDYDFASILTGLPNHELIDVCDSEPGSGTQGHRTYVSPREGTTWHRTRSPVDQYVDEGAAGSAGGFVAGDRGNLLRLRSAGGRWSAIPRIGGDDEVSNLGFYGGRYGWVLNFSDLWLTDDGGRRWHRATRP